MNRFLTLALLFFLLPGGAGAANARPASLETLRNTPLYFEPNLGQTAPGVRYLARGQGYVFFLTEGEAVWRLHPRLPDQIRPDQIRPDQISQMGQAARPRTAVIRLRLGGADARLSAPRALEPLPQVSHYYIGRDPRRWAEGVPAYGRVRYEGVYPGIDMEFYGKGPLLEYDFVVAPGADPRRILLAFEGAERLRVTADGDLLIESGGLVLRHGRPFAYQEKGGVRREVPSAFELRGGNEVAFRLAAHDPALPLVIDPAVTLATYLGGNGDDAIQAVAVDDAGAIYVTGRTTSTNFPTTTGAISGSLSGSNDLFVAKFAPDGRIVYATYLGSGSDQQSEDSGRGIALDDQGRVYVTGSVSASFTFPATPGAFDETYNGGFTDAFVVRLGADGQLEYASYLGDEQRYDVGTAIAVGENSLVYVAGYTAQASRFPSTFPVKKNGAQTTHGGVTDAFLVKLDLRQPGSQALQYGSFFGGEGGEEALALALAGNGVAYIAGTTNSDGLATQGAYQSGWVNNDGFIARFDTRTPGTTGLRATYVNAPGCGSADTKDAVRVTGLAVADGDVIAAGDTLCGNLPLEKAFDTTFGGVREAFVLALDDNLATLRFASFFGGSGDETAAGIALDGFGQAYLVGGTTSSALPRSGANAAGNFPYGGDEDAFVAKLARQGDGGFDLRFSLYLGGSGDDRALAVAADATGNVHVAGRTASVDFPTYLAPASPRDFSEPQGEQDGFLLRFGPVADLALTVTDNDNVAVGANVVFDINVANQGPDDAQEVSVTATLPASLNYQGSSLDNHCSYDSQSRRVTCALGMLPQGGMITLYITARLGADNGDTVDFNVSALASDVVPGNNTVTVKINDDDPGAGGGGNTTPPLTIVDGDGHAAGGGGGGGGGGALGWAWLLLGAGYYSCAFRRIPV